MNKEPIEGFNFKDMKRWGIYISNKDKNKKLPI